MGRRRERGKWGGSEREGDEREEEGEGGGGREGGRG